jgi:PhnB protein
MLSPYLFFDGKCREALTFYQKVLGGELVFMTYGDAPNCPKGAKDRIIHGQLQRGDVVLRASDTPDYPPDSVGNSIHLSLDLKTQEEIERVYQGLSTEGSADVPLHESHFANRFGMLTDRYGIHWMLMQGQKK